MKKVLVTGGTGFVGRAVLPKLLERGFAVHVLSRTQARDLPPGVEAHVGDVLDRDQVKETLDRLLPTHLLHLAWVTTPGRYLTSAKNVVWTQESISLVRQFATGGGRRALIAGTCMEYDLTQGLLQEEVTPLTPSTPYGKAKHSLHAALRSECDGLSLSLGWARLFYLYGPFERPERLVPYVIQQLKDGQVAEVTAGNQSRDYLYVEDAAQALAAFLDSDVAATLNVGSGDAVSVRAIVGTIGRLLGRPELIRWGARTPDDSAAPPVIQADTSRVRSVLKWEPSVDHERGLQRTVAWWQEKR